MKKILKYIFLVWLLVTIAGAAYYWRYIYMVATFNPIIFSPGYDEPQSTVEARRQDLHYLRRLLDYDRSFSAQEQSEFLAQVDAAVQRVAAMSDAEFYLAISRAVAVADNGHTSVSYWPLYRQFNRIGVKLHWFSDGLYVVRADAENASLLGSRVTSIEGHPVEAVVAALVPFRGGNMAWRRLWMPAMIESPQIMQAAGLSASPDALAMSLQAPDGTTRDVLLDGALIGDAQDLEVPAAWMALQPELLPGETGAWVRAIEPSKANVPLYLTETSAPLVAPLEGNGLYIRTRSGFGSDEQSVEDFLEAALSGHADGTLDYLVVDYRLNLGGDYLRSIEFARAAPRKLKAGGKLYIVVGPSTFSAGIVTVAMLKYYGAGMAVIIGSPMGDREQFWAERGMAFELPNSGYYINYATAYHDWANGCADQPYCYTFNTMYEVPAGSLAPQTVFEPAYADYAAGRDVALEWIRLDRNGAE